MVRTMTGNEWMPLARTHDMDAGTERAGRSEAGRELSELDLERVAGGAKFGYFSSNKNGFNLGFVNTKP